MESVMILEFVEILQFSKVLISLVWTQFKPNYTQFKALEIFLGPLGTPLWEGGGKGGSEHPPDPPATFERANARFPNWDVTAAVVIFWLTPWKVVVVRTNRCHVTLASRIS